MDALLRIGEVAAFYGVSVKAMRLYEKMGIIKPVKVDDNTGYRYYTADSVRELDALLELRELGFSLAEIKKLLEGGLTGELYMEALVHKKTAWQDRIAVARDKIETIDGIIEKLQNAKPAVKLHELTEDERARLLSQLACVDANLHTRNTHTPDLLSEALWV